MSSASAKANPALKVGAAAAEDTAAPSAAATAARAIEAAASAAAAPRTSALGGAAASRSLWLLRLTVERPRTRRKARTDSGRKRR